ncbi:hypothetical protein [Blastococcus brunescens]|uniref:Uncharacterized protein n=1 Tax=Blastococcus brunescens TaxID=1564165 RepID=A0ABZ1AWT4_9ACTN|nr:hypothetical protein [Blastococcus sp. BMG 8361]WRL62582.1 hypothetical protein U6N30_21760 [Blastococcus sp. BMG 8361]
MHRLIAVQLRGQLIPTARWPSVSAKGRAASTASSRPPVRRGRARPGSSAAARRRAARVSWRISASSHFSRCAARSTSSMVVGRWMSRRAAASGRIPCRLRISSGNGSSTRPARLPAGPSSSFTDFWMTQLETSLLAG